MKQGNSKPIILLLMGVSGSGKTTVGIELARALGLPFYDADGFHPPENVKKMSAGIPLTDADRLPWLEAMAEKLKEWREGNGATLVCSELKESYRKILSAGLRNPIWILLAGNKELIWSRISRRKDHFMPASLLDSQLDTLEIPEYALVVDIDRTPEEIVRDILDMVKERDSA